MARDKPSGTSASTATRSPKAQAPWSPSHGRTPSSTTPAGRTPGSTGHRPSSMSKGVSSHGGGPLHVSSPNYFEFVAEPDSNPPNSNAGIHAKKNWSPSSGGGRTALAGSPENYPLESQKRFENFRRESETSSFNLSHGNLRQFSTSSGTRISPTVSSPVRFNKRRDSESHSPTPPKSNSDPTSTTANDDPMNTEPPDDLADVPRRPLNSNLFFGEERRESPANDSNLDLSALQRTQLSHIDEKHPRNSLPHNRADPLQESVQRSETLPSSLRTDGPTMLTPEEFVGILTQYSPQDVLILDLRVYPQFSKSRMIGALNLCIPTTLLKRASFSIQRLAETFTKESERAKFDQWPNVKALVVYDGSSNQLQDATSCVNILKKFTAEKWKGATFILRGGFNMFSKKFPDKIDKRPANEIDGSNMKGLTIYPPASAPVAGGCAMPANQTAANPFFGNIRQNMDLIGGVGQMPVTIPSAFKNRTGESMPKWLQRVSDPSDKGHLVADRFLAIEKAEEQRMKKALSSNVSYGSPNPLSPSNVQVAGIEKGLKNRYKDILPYDHSRVKLQGVESGGCDYINASHVEAHGSNKRYIACQAPVPATFQDFWRVIWEQDARVIVMLTAETEGGNRKSHPYWVPASYGSFKIKSLSERKSYLERRHHHHHGRDTPNRSFTTPFKASPTPDKDKGRPSMSRRHSSKPSFSSPSTHSSSSSKTPIATSSTSTSTLSPPLDPETTPYVTIRKVALSNTSKPFEPLREITQLQYSNWPDFGAPAHPAHVLGLVERTGEVVRSYERLQSAGGGGEGGGGGAKGFAAANNEPAPEGERPVIVHCSAGCGRTGTFCTVDSVVDMLKRQRQVQRQPEGLAFHSNTEGEPYRAGRVPPLTEEDAGMHDAMDIDAPSQEISSSQLPDADTGGGGLDGDGEKEMGDGESADADAWQLDDGIDLVSRTVADFRLQRTSMVQTLRQFVLCYESVLEWLAEEVSGVSGGEVVGGKVGRKGSGGEERGGVFSR